MAVLPDGEPTADSGPSQVQSQSEEDQASTEGLQKKPKAAPKKSSTSSIKLSDWVTSTTKIKVCWDQIIIDHDRNFGQVRRISDDRVQRRYDELKAAPPVHYIQDLLFYKVTRMCCCILFDSTVFVFEFSTLLFLRLLLRSHSLGSVGGSACLHCCPKTQDRIGDEKYGDSGLDPGIWWL